MFIFIFVCIFVYQTNKFKQFRIPPILLNLREINNDALMRRKQVSSVPNKIDTIPVTSRRIGSWRICVSRYALPPGELAERYDLVAKQWQRTATRYQLDTAYRAPLHASGAPAALLAKAGQAQVLDCGIGTGSLSLALNQLLQQRVNWHGIDTSTEMLNEASSGMHQAGIAPELKQADVQSLPYPSASFDLVMAAHVLEHLPEPRQGLLEMVRVLKPGGKLFICMTRQSLFGALVKLRWRTWTVSESQTLTWLRDCLLADVGLSPVKLGPLAGWASTAFWASRPA